MTPEALAAQRVAAVAQLEAQLQAHATEAQQRLYAGLLDRLTDLHADPSLLPALLQEYTATVLVPLAAFYGQSLLHLPGLNLAYFQGLSADYQQLRAPLLAFIQQNLGLDSAGALVPGGYLASVAADTTVAQQVLLYAAHAQASGIGLTAYREGLQQLVTGGDAVASGVVGRLYAAAGDDMARLDRGLQVVAGKQLGLTAYLYQGGLIASSRPFCVARNGKVFLDWEIERFGTKADAFGGYTKKSEGLFSGKSEPYEPFTSLGGYGCRHTLHAVPGAVAVRMRPELEELPDGKLRIKT